MRGQASLAVDKRGTGGFMEAIFAIMVISSAVALMVVVVPELGTTDQGRSGLRSEAERLADRILAIASEDGLVIQAASLYEVKAIELEMEAGHGLRASLSMMGGTAHEIGLLSRGSPPDDLGECYVVREPVCYSPDGMVVQAALLVVMAW
jgi:hypothetical protein